MAYIILIRPAAILKAFPILNRDTTSAGKQIYAVEASGAIEVMLGTNGAGLQSAGWLRGSITTYRNNAKDPA
jgi:hypothetical protein